MVIKCDYCNNIFTRNSTLKRHQEQAKYCLKKQGNATTEYNCGYCNKHYIRLDKYEQHIKSCAITFKQKQKLDVLSNQNRQLSEQINQLQSQIMMLMTTHQAQNINNTNDNSRNMVVQNLQPITDAEMQEHSDHLTLDFILEGAKGFANFANSYPYKDKVVCTDHSRKKLKYRSEKGDIIDDPNGKQLTQRFFHSIAKKNNQLINSEYKALQEKVTEIASGDVGNVDLSELLTKSVQLQETLRLCNEAANGGDNELTQDFIRHLTKQL